MNGDDDTRVESTDDAVVTVVHPALAMQAVCFVTSLGNGALRQIQTPCMLW